jgi:hypothetical protein
MYKILFEARRPLACQKATAQMANKAWERPSVARLLSFCLYLLRLEFLFRFPLPQLAAKSIPCFAAKEEHESWPWPSWELRRLFESQWGREFSASSQPCNFTGPLFRIISIWIFLLLCILLLWWLKFSVAYRVLCKICDFSFYNAIIILFVWWRTIYFTVGGWFSTMMPRVTRLRIKLQIWCLGFYHRCISLRVRNLIEIFSIGNDLKETQDEYSEW